MDLEPMSSPGLVFSRLVRLFHYRMNRSLSAEGMYRGQPPILMLLYCKDGITQREMGELLGLSPATITVTLKRMEKAGLVTRAMDSQDQRMMRVHLSEQGRRMCALGKEHMESVMGEMLHGFNKRERDRLFSFLVRIEDNLARAIRVENMEEKRLGL